VYRRERFDLFTRGLSGIKARVISRPIVRWGSFEELLARGTHLGQGVNPVRRDSRFRGREKATGSGRLEHIQTASKSALRSLQPAMLLRPDL